MKLTAKVIMFAAMRYGKGMKLEELAKTGHFGKTKERVRQFEAKVLREVRANDPDGLATLTGIQSKPLTGHLSVVK